MSRHVQPDPRRPPSTRRNASCFGPGRAADQALTGTDDLAGRLPDSDRHHLAFGGFLASLPPVLRTLVLATVAVPIVIYASCPSCKSSGCTS
jgi:hypothetical protein